MRKDSATPGPRRRAVSMSRKRLYFGSLAAAGALAAVDLNGDGAVDVITSANRGTFIFWNQMHASKPAARKK